MEQLSASASGLCVTRELSGPDHTVDAGDLTGDRAFRAYYKYSTGCELPVIVTHTFLTHEVNVYSDILHKFSQQATPSAHQLSRPRLIDYHHREDLTELEHETQRDHAKRELAKAKIFINAEFSARHSEHTSTATFHYRPHCEYAFISTAARVSQQTEQQSTGLHPGEWRDLKKSFDLAGQRFEMVQSTSMTGPLKIYADQAYVSQWKGKLKSTDVGTDWRLKKHISIDIACKETEAFQETLNEFGYEVMERS